MTRGFAPRIGSVFSAEYGVTLDVKQRGRRFDFLGAANLGVWGRYETTGYATATQFRATYRSKLDYGTFEMQRVDPMNERCNERRIPHDTHGRIL